MLKFFSLEDKRRKDEFYKKHNIKYEDIFLNNSWWRFYDDLGDIGFNMGFFMLYNETYLKWLELIEKYNFKIYYFKNSSKCDKKLSFDDLKPKNPYSTKDDWKDYEKNYLRGLSKNNINVKNIKELQFNDLICLYKNLSIEVLYIFPKVSSSKIYYFDFILVVNKDFNLEKFLKINFELIKIENFEELIELNISFDKVKEIFESRFILDDNRTSFDSSYKLPHFSQKEYIETYKNGVKNLADFDELVFLQGNYMYKNFNQDLYIKDFFELLCTQIWSFDEFYTRKKTKFGLEINKECIYNIDSSILLKNTMGVISAGKDPNTGILNIEKVEYDGFILSDGFSDWDIVGGTISKEYVKNGFIDFNNSEIIHENTKN